MQKEIIYVGDPMCSWCYGFTNVIQAVRQQYKHRAKVSLIMGGLRPDGTHVVDDRYSNFLKGHWWEIGERTGQPFDLSILDQIGWIYDTEKPCRAVVVMRNLKPEVEWDYFAAVQKGFYHQNHNPNEPGSFARIAATFGVDELSFLQAFHDGAAAAETQRDFRAARSLDVDSFPTVLVRDDRGYAVLTNGYRPFEILRGSLDRWLAG